MIYLLKRKHDNKLRTTLLGRVARSISYALQYTTTSYNIHQTPNLIQVILIIKFTDTILFIYFSLNK